MSEFVRKLLLGASLACVVLLGACSQKVEFRNVDITGASFAKDFSLTDAAGRKRTLADYRGKAVAIFFGYTQCPDVCPTTMFEMSEVMKRLGGDADKVQVLFVTIDPERDTPTLLGQYVPAFDPRFVGLTGTPDDVAKVAQDFKVFYRKVPGTVDPKFYTMDHFAGMYLFDPQGRVRVLVQYGQKPDAITADLKTLLKAG
ncbi:SCO family protein [soil metagenome]